MQSDSKAWSARARDHSDNDVEALAAFGSEVFEPSGDQSAEGAGPDALELFPHEWSASSVAPASDAPATRIAAAAPPASVQPGARMAPMLVGVTLVGLAIGLWSSLQWEDAPIQIADVALSAPDQTRPAPLLPHQAAPPPVVPLREVQRPNAVLPPAPIPSAPEPAGRDTRSRAAVSRRTTSRPPIEEPVRTTRAGEPVTRPRLPATPATQGPLSRTTPPSLSAVEAASTTAAPVRQPDSSTPLTPSTPTSIDRPAPSITPAVPAGAPPASAPAETSAAGSTRAATPAPESASTARETADIQGVLTRYAAAFSALDPGAVRNVWPTVDSRALTRAFRGLQEQAIAFDSCNIRATGTSAAASCGGTVRYVTRIGSKEPRSEHRQWQFRMRKVGERWLIDTVESH